MKKKKRMFWVRSPPGISDSDGGIIFHLIRSFFDLIRKFHV